jgi:hypothetical protein
MGLILGADVQQVIGGDVASLAVLPTVPQSLLLEEVGNVSLVVDRESVARVLRSLDRHEVEGEDVQQWASFVRRGFVAGEGRGPIKPLSIEYELAYEDAIADIISKLDEIGDVIDGEVPDKGETAIYLASLGLADENWS